MKRPLTIYMGMLILLAGLNACEDNPVREEPEITFPLEFTFYNKNDSTVYGGFDINLSAYYPKSDNSYYRYSGFSGPAVGEKLYEVLPDSGYPGVKIGLTLSAMKIWPDQGNGHQSKKWFCIEQKTVENEQQATMHFTWPDDTTRSDVHTFDPDTTTDATMPCF